jgi:hypothetical protein
MTLDQLQIFIAVAEREHVTRAADALGFGKGWSDAELFRLFGLRQSPRRSLPSRQSPCTWPVPFRSASL